MIGGWTDGPDRAVPSNETLVLNLTYNPCDGHGGAHRPPRLEALQRGEGTGSGFDLFRPCGIESPIRLFGYTERQD